jgi:hypothetical protein|tara:strand:+ start:32722 stop:33183 length:462 start_codon:yes stop_codon:yes gene_type:complete
MKILFCILLVLPILITGCKQLESITEDISVLTQLKSEIPTAGPYSYEDHELLSDYFSGLNLLIKKIDDHPKGKKGLAKYIRKNGLVNTCGKILVDKESWASIKANCWKGEYFICSEDVLEFEDSINLFANNLEGGNRSTFLSNEACAGNWDVQ